MSNLDPANDLKIDKYSLDYEASTISSLIQQYDQEWNNTVGRLENLNAKIDNICDELKNLRMTLSFKAKSDWVNIPELDKNPSDKLAESWAFSQKEYKEKFRKLKDLREEKAVAFTKEQLFKNYHFQLLDKSRNIDVLTRQWTAQYFTSDRTLDNSKKSSKVTEKMTEEMNVREKPETKVEKPKPRPKPRPKRKRLLKPIDDIPF